MPLWMKKWDTYFKVKRPKTTYISNSLHTSVCIKGVVITSFHSYNGPILLEPKLFYLSSFLYALKKLNEPKRRRLMKKTNFFGRGKGGTNKNFIFFFLVLGYWLLYIWCSLAGFVVNEKPHCQLVEPWLWTHRKFQYQSQWWLYSFSTYLQNKVNMF